MQEWIQKIKQNINKSTSRCNDKIVNFAICGTQKGGTSALNAYLREHPEICMSKQKEVHFFDNEDFFANKKPDYSWYHSFFIPNEKQKIIGEATPIYMYWRDAPRRMWEYNPAMKLIVILRNPIDRAYSHWNMEQGRNADNLPFWDAIQTEQERCRIALPYQHRVYSYIDRGFYLEQLRRLWMYFSKERVLILKFEYLKHQAEEALRDVCNFLEIDPFKNVETKDVNSTPYISKMRDIERKYLQSIFEYEIQNIERVLGWDCRDWLSK